MRVDAAHGLASELTGKLQFARRDLHVKQAVILLGLSAGRRTQATAECQKHGSEGAAFPPARARPELFVKRDRGLVPLVGLNIDDPSAAQAASASEPRGQERAFLLRLLLIKCIQYEIGRLRPGSKPDMPMTERGDNSRMPRQRADDWQSVGR